MQEVGFDRSRRLSVILVIVGGCEKGGGGLGIL